MSGLAKTGLSFVTGGASSWIPWAIVALIIAGLGVTVFVQHERLTALKTELQATKDADAKTIQALTQERDMQAQDAKRQAAAVAQLQSVVNDQAAELTKLKADFAQAQQVADQAEADRQKQIAGLQKQITNLRMKANAHPEQVKALGPIVIDALTSLRGETGGTSSAPATAPPGS